MFGWSKKKVDLLTPFPGTVMDVTAVPDQVFADEMLGPGVAVVPDESCQVLEVCAPVSGQIVTIFNTMHAFAIRDKNGVDVLVHIGLDTVALRGAGFEAFVSAGDSVKAGELVVRVDAAAVRRAGKSLITPVVLTNKKQVANVTAAAHKVQRDDVVAHVTLN
ncbi:PTS glucose transporter subunit IIA [Corynebacterium felinum]|uniref:Glucose-specific phosphotransferase system IIA component n=1 Tax=Corynebacterium felinum TaxID=131318 RepID=A0ABU2B598_9CORY|nr:PTS glucose transporter subunit IIA [Corynebacterium felinum]MDF5821441.1 PTS glucose transporter subunit IIA [Corynebacterium felinum]MDR7353792.1 glucose-specific phosphotransferase system IIA component [Corynebacterium felinum]WJY95971.1 Glucose-specific phosphotransferase enzyme IIA component [Corynebacterium felinum]